MSDKQYKPKTDATDCWWLVYITTCFVIQTTRFNTCNKLMVYKIQDKYGTNKPFEDPDKSVLMMMYRYELGIHFQLLVKIMFVWWRLSFVWWSSLLLDEVDVLSDEVDPFMSSGLFYLNSLDRSISHLNPFKGCLVRFYYCHVCRNFWTLRKQCRPWSDAAFCGVWSGSTLFANVHFRGC